MMELEAQIRRLITDMLPTSADVEALPLDQPWDEIGMNSIDFIKILVEIESLYQISFEEEDMDLSEYKNLKSLLTIVENKLQEGNT